MSYSIIKDIKDNITIGYTTKLYDRPDKPDDLVVLKESTGVKATGESTLAVYRDSKVYVTVNVFMRITNAIGAYDTMMTELDSIVEQIAELTGKEINGKTIGKFSDEAIIPIGVDTKGRWNASVNLNIMYNR